jgi:HEXXH motif-containing protein
LAPSASRVDEIDRTLRARLADSLRYLGEFAALDVSRQAALEKVEDKLRSVAVSPWIFGLYAKLVAALSNTPRVDVGGVFDAITQAASLPAEEGVVAFRDSANPAAWWDHFRILLDTDRKRPFNPRGPNAKDFALCKQELEEALAFFETADPVWHDEVARLLRMIVLGSPQSAEVRDVFNGASTFFLWGAALLNAEIRRTTVSIIDLLVHESSHGLLFGFSAEGALTRNSGEERYTSPLRSDARPIDGIFHACFVATRVHLGMSRLLESGRLTPGEAKQAIERRDFNGNAAATALQVLAQHAKPTNLGEEILGTIRKYWATMPLD